MNPLRISARNYRTFRDLDLELPEGCAAIVGANGAGKSSLLNLIDVALFADRGELADLLTAGDDTLSLELEFEHGGSLYRVRRMYSAKGRGKTTLDFDLNTTDWQSMRRWESLNRETVAATQDAICATVELTRQTFRASSFLAQSDGAAFTEAAPRDRKAILAEILGLEIWDRLLARVREDIRDDSDERIRRLAAISGLDEQISHRDAIEAQRAGALVERDQARAAIETLEAASLELQKQTADCLAEGSLRELAERAAADADRIEGELRAACEASATVEERRIALTLSLEHAARLPEFEAVVAAAEREKAYIDEERHRLDRLLSQWGQLEEERERLVSSLAEMVEEISAAVDRADRIAVAIEHSETCAMCGQTLGREAAAIASANYRSSAEEMDARVQEIYRRLGEVEQLQGKNVRLQARITPREAPDVGPVLRQIDAARAALSDQGRLEEQIAAMDTLAGRRHELAVALQKAGEDAHTAASRLPDAPADRKPLEALAADREALTASLDTETNRLLGASTAAAVAEQRLAEIDTAQTTRCERQNDLVLLDERLAGLRLAERAYGRDGIPALILERDAIPKIETDSNWLLGELGGSTAGCRLELRTLRELKSGDGLRDTLDIIIRTSEGDRPYESFSEGERTRLNLALRIALARLLAHRRGAESRLLAIDEPDGLDLEGMGLLAKLLEGLQQEFDRIFVVSHNPGLATAFDQTIRVEKTNGRSRVAAPTMEVHAPAMEVHA